MFTEGDDYAGVDFDYTDDRALFARHKEWAERLNSYSERSPSKTGLHVIVKGRVPKGIKSKHKIEVYSSGRFFTMTGDVYRHAPIADRNAELNALWAELNAERATVDDASVVMDVPQREDDQTILDRASRADNGDKFTRLWNGDLSNNANDHSRADAALCELLAFYTSSADQIERLWIGSPLGNRDKTQRRKNYRQRTIKAALARVAERRPVPIDTSALDAQFASMGLPPSPSVGNAPVTAVAAFSSPPADTLVVRRVSDVPIERIEWLWSHRFAIGKLSILTGDPGLGKSQFSLMLAAKVTTGGEWPNGEGSAPQGDVVLLSCEDEVGDTIRPRLEAAGADVSRVVTIDSVAAFNGKRRSFDLQSDLAKLDALLAGANGTVKLVIIDPISAYMGGGGKDTHKASDVRSVLAPVGELAAKYDVAVVAVAHPSKVVAGGKAVNAVGGSQAFVAASRVAWLFTNEFEQSEDTSERIPTGRVLVTEAKNNLGKAKGLAYKICTRSIHTNIGEVIASYVGVEHGYIDTTADQALSGPPSEQRLNRSQSERAKTFLQFELSSGDMEASLLMVRAQQYALTEKTLQRAAKELGILKRREGFGPGSRVVWGYAKTGDDLFGVGGLGQVP